MSDPVMAARRRAADLSPLMAPVGGAAAGHLSELADEVESTHEHLRLARRGRANLVLLTEDEFASMQETIALRDAPRGDTYRP
jgi:PHD/YefM family antitoxin component YafN of YafNO toxin-antitoxin module